MTEQPIIDTSVPHSARVWNYWQGGKDHYDVDERLGREMAAAFPWLPDIARHSRQFLARVVRYLVTEGGVRQFLDLGTGLPTDDNTHEIAQCHAPESRIVYVDHDPAVLAHARALLKTSPEGSTAYIHSDLRDPDTVLAEAAATLDLSRPVAVLCLSTLGHIPPAQAAELMPSYTSRLVAGSHLAVCDTLTSEELKRGEEMYEESGTMPYTARTVEEIAATAEGLEILPPGVGPITLWRPDEDQPVDSRQWGYLARK